MASVTGHDSFPIEPGAIQLEHHSHHVAPHCLFPFVLSFPQPGVLSGLGVLLAFHVAMITINAKRITRKNKEERDEEPVCDSGIKHSENLEVTQTDYRQRFILN
jgi:hypothetical protein